MKKSITWRSIISMALALILCVSLPVTIWAETEVIPNPDGTTTVITTNDPVTNTDGDKTTVIVTITEATDGTTTDGVKVDRDVTTTTTTTTTPNSSKTVTEEKGSEKKEWTEDVKPGEDVPSLNLGMSTGMTDSVTGDPVKEGPDGDLPTDAEDKEYDYTQSESTIEREASGKVNVEENFVIIPEDSTLNCPVGPEDYEGKQYYDYSDDKCVSDGHKYDIHYREGLLKGYYDKTLGKFIAYDEEYFANKNVPVDDKPTTDGYEAGYDMTWVGYGEVTDGISPAVGILREGMDPYLRDEEGNILTENGFPVYNMESFDYIVTNNKMENDPDTNYSGTGMFLQPVMFALQHENGEYFYAYCMDAATGANPTKNRWYNINNLEDLIEPEEGDDDENTYITAEEAGMIRAIANAGYWGNEAGKGSVESLKELLRDIYDADDKVNVRYQGSNDVEYSATIYDLIDGLTEAEALAATQAAIWTFSNSNDYLEGYFGDNATLVSLFSASKYHNGTKPEENGFLSAAKPAKDYESDARMQALYKALLGLDPVYADSELREDSFVIPNEGILDDVQLEIMDKAEDVTENTDEDDTNDVYNTNVKFKLTFIPTANDDLLLQINYVDYDGKPVSMVKRLGADGEENSDTVIMPDENGNYVIHGVKLAENQNFDLNLQLTGTQYLQNGVYVYQAEGGRKESQTLVGLAEGTQSVSVTTTVTLNFNVDEVKNVVTEHYWGSVNDPETETTTPPPSDNNPPPSDNNPPPSGGDTPPTTENNPPMQVNYEEEIDEEEVPLNEEPEEDYEEDDEIEILDEEVPLAEVPETGDVSDVMMLLVILSVIGLIAINLPAKKRFNV